MRKGLLNPNSIQAIKELKNELASEIGITNVNELSMDVQDQRNAELNKKLVARAKNNLIGFK